MLGGLHSFAGVTTQLFRRAVYSSTARSTVVVASAQIQKDTTLEESSTEAEKAKSKNSLVAAAFESLREDTKNPSTVSKKVYANTANQNNEIDERIIKAKTVSGLLSLSETSSTLSRKHALKIVSILAEWSSMDRVKISEFENDSRFLRICRVLGRTVPKNSAGNDIGNGKTRVTGFRTDDLNTVLGVAGDDEAAKLIASISLPQMVKVMSTLAQRKRRSTPLLRSLAYNISSSTDILDLKQCADILYAMASLNFQDSVLAAKVCVDIQIGLPKNIDKSAVVGSVLTSLGILKYRDLDILESLTKWTLQNSDICRPHDISALFLTSSMLDFKSIDIEEVSKKLVRAVVKDDFQNMNDWLNHVWALAMMGLADQTLLETVLSENFIQKMQTCKNGLTLTSKMKLLNLNSYAKLLSNNYKGSFLPTTSSVFNVPIIHGKSKALLLNGLLDALKSLLPTKNYVNSLVDSKMGFLIDAICVFDAKRNPLPLDVEHQNGTKVALMVVDFHDICHGPHRSVSGIINLTFALLEKSGYKVIPVPFNEFNTSDKLLKRVQYLEGKFKEIIKS